MTTSYTTSLRMKELGFPQEGGEYYWVKSPQGAIAVAHRQNEYVANYGVVCRAFTLGELVRMFGDCQIAITKLLNFNSVTITSLHEPITGVSEISPEEAAAELAIELVKEGAIKFDNQNQTP